MNHRKYITVIILGLTASLLASCNGGGNTGNTPAVVPEPIVITPPPVMPEPTKEEQLAKLEAELATVDTELATLDTEFKTMLGQAQCASSLDCRFLGFSPNGCTNRYDYYAVYSTKQENLQEHLSAVSQQKEQLASRKAAILRDLCLVIPQDQQRRIDCFDQVYACPAVMPSGPLPSASCINNQCKGIDSPIFVEGSDAGIIREQINAMIDYPVCSSSEQCGVWQVGYSLTGESPSLCGKDTTFAYSTFATDPKEIAAKVGQYAQSVAANYNAQGFNAVCQSSVSFANGVCRNEKCEAN
ncbi:hypothetical protein [Thiothrix subterranea]|uniref:Uncharacterized protein n=1 Tax=Thiothrix subterranea TaxID=2735563 RepID=A0AA51MTK0_9GAMM|nr:hypothetical protein [Thiothrix subterranea]MDQ5767042.1 hypothetical protein [Thiothrix subterranea]WML88096.1 hypothetical protein RCG00_06910 [Thiothrix subterranea]